jgi:uncharacterized protein (DUF488 family)
VREITNLRLIFYIIKNHRKIYKQLLDYWLIQKGIKMVTLSRDEILKNIAGKSDEIKLEMLEKVTKNIEADQETRKTAFLLMTDIYIKKMWWRK